MLLQIKEVEKLHCIFFIKEGANVIGADGVAFVRRLIVLDVLLPR
jgi:hypothetical protein